MLLAQSVFPCVVVRQKDCATIAFRCRFAAAVCCHSRSFPLHRRNLEIISPFRHAAPVRACHSEPVLTLAWQSVPAPAGAEPPSLQTTPIFPSLRASDRCHWRGNPSPPSQCRRRGTLFTCCLRRGTFVSSDKSTQKRRLKLRFKTSSARYALCQACLMFLAQSPFLCTVVGQKDCATTAFRYRFAAATQCHDRSVPLYRRNLERISPFRHAAPVRACHSEPVLTLAWQSVSLLTSDCHSVVIANQ